MVSDRTTPARQQYLDVKARYPHALVWFRLGDFYEMFDEDARVASTALRITLTSRQFGKGVRVPMCGVPYHAQARFLARLVRQGFSVAICEQMSPPGRGLVEREVIRVVTPGTISEPEILRAGENNYLAAVTRRAGAYALAYVDVSTGEFRVTQTDDAQALTAELERLQAAECLVEDRDALPELPVRHLTAGETSLWDAATSGERLRRHIGARALHIAGCESSPAPAAAAGAILGYLERTNRALLPILHTLRPYSIDDAVAIDATTRAMLLGRASGHERESSVYALLDRTTTAMGARLLARRLRRPVRDAALLRDRLDAIQELLEDGARRQATREALRAIGDLERLTARTGQERATTEELLTICETLEALPALLEALGTPHGALLRMSAAGIDPALDIAAGIRAAVAEPGSNRRIRAGYDAEIDRLAELVADARTHLAAMEADEREHTGIRSLKVGFNQVFGYYIEVTNPNLGKVPSSYVRKQTLAHAERFVTPDLLHWESMLAEADLRLQEADQARFLELQRAITAESARLLRTADALAEIDVAAALADVAETHSFCRPVLEDDTALHIEGARHPLVEQALGLGAFIPNDCALGGDAPPLAIVTGPNMGGKSTYLRAVALIVYLAQVGCFVPARAAHIGLADRIFARVGAHDDIAAGHSTFLVEMAETAAIVRLATPLSLVLLDEIGRGTTSADGLAIARAVAEHLHEVVGARTLFATHYYELARAAQDWPQARNLHVRAEEHEGAVVFLYRVAPGVADKSFALHVARMAGMPEPITLRAADLLAATASSGDGQALEQDGVARDDARRGRAVAESPPALGYLPGARHEHARAPGSTSERHLAEVVAPTSGDGEQLTPGDDALARELLAIDLASTTPIDALNRLLALQQRARTLMQQANPATARERRGHRA